MLALLQFSGAILAAVGAVVDSPAAQAAGTAVNSGILLWMSARITRLEVRMDAKGKKG
jgi:hypothetical protein